MKSNELIIIIAGVSASGKSTFAASIANLCREHGIDVVYTKEEKNDDKFLAEKFIRLKEKGTKVNIIENMTNREPIRNTE